MTAIDVYGPCSCGSGKKLKFCCYQKGKELEALTDRDLILRANQFPLTKCFINADWVEQGIAQIFIVRHLLTRKFLVGIYLVDTFCLGLKDSFIRSHLSDKDLSGLLRRREIEMEEISYEDARSIIFGAIEFAEKYGFAAKNDDGVLNIIEPEREFERKFSFGREGKPFFIQGPYDDVSPIMEKLGPHLISQQANCMINAPLEVL